MPPAQRASVRWDPARTRPSALIAAIRAAGYDAVPDAAAPARELRRHEHRQALWRLFVAAFCAMQVMMLATPSYVADAGELAPDLRQLLNWGQLAADAAGGGLRGRALLHAAPGAALRDAAHRHGLPVALGIGVAFVASTGATFDAGWRLRRRGLLRFGDDVRRLPARRALSGTARAPPRRRATWRQRWPAMPATARRELDDGGVESVSVPRLRPATGCACRWAKLFPADGVLIDGATQADEALLTGESHAGAQAGRRRAGGRQRQPGCAGAPEGGAGRRRHALRGHRRDDARRADRSVPPRRSSADRWAGPFLWAVLLLAAGAAAVWSLIDPARALSVAVAVLIVTCPCALSLAAPSALVAAAGGLARRGVLLQRLDAIEALARVAPAVRRQDRHPDRGAGRRRLRCCRLPGAATDPATLRLRHRPQPPWPRWSTHPLARRSPAATRRPRRCRWPQVRGACRPRPARACDASGRALAAGLGRLAGRGRGTGPSTRRCVAVRRPAGRRGRLVERDIARPDAVAVAGGAARPTACRSPCCPATAAARVQRAGRAARPVRRHVGDATPQDKLAAVRAAQARGQPRGDGRRRRQRRAGAGARRRLAGDGAGRPGGACAGRRGGGVGPLARRRACACHGARDACASCARTWPGPRPTTLVCIPLAVVGWLPPWAAGLGMALSSLIGGAAMRCAPRADAGVLTDGHPLPADPVVGRCSCWPSWAVFGWALHRGQFEDLEREGERILDRWT